MIVVSKVRGLQTRTMAPRAVQLVLIVQLLQQMVTPPVLHRLLLSCVWSSVVVKRISESWLCCCLPRGAKFKDAHRLHCSSFLF